MNRSPHFSQVGYPLVEVHFEVGDSLQIQTTQVPVDGIQVRYGHCPTQIARCERKV